MDHRKRNLKGSESRDEFKRRHKDLNSCFYAVDADLCLISKNPPGTVAYIDLKNDCNDAITFAEVIKYNEWMKTAPIFIVYSESPSDGPFFIRRYLGGDWKPNNPPCILGRQVVCFDWQDFGKWEGMLRQEYEKRGGWVGWSLDGDNLVFGEE